MSGLTYLDDTNTGFYEVYNSTRKRVSLPTDWQYKLNHKQKKKNKYAHIQHMAALNIYLYLYTICKTNPTDQTKIIIKHMINYEDLSESSLHKAS